MIRAYTAFRLSTIRGGLQIRRLLSERMGLRAIARVTGVSRSWLQGFVNALYRDDTPHHPGPLQKSPAGW